MRAFYGPTEYGGGGVLDPQDATRFFYKGLEFKLDWKAGTRSARARLLRGPIRCWRRTTGTYSPDTPLYPGRAKGPALLHELLHAQSDRRRRRRFLWRDGEQAARLVAALGNAHSWPVLREAEFRALWPQGTKPEEENPQPEALATFAWTDANGDGRPQPDEVQFDQGAHVAASR